MPCWSVALFRSVHLISNAGFMPRVIFWSQPAGIYDRPVILKSDTHGQWASIHPNGELVLVNAPVTLHWIILYHSLHSFSYHAPPSKVAHLVVPSWRNRSHATLYSCCCHSESAAYGKMANQFLTHGEGTPTCDHWRDFSDFFGSCEVFLHHHWRVVQVHSPILEQLWGLAHQAKAF